MRLIEQIRKLNEMEENDSLVPSRRKPRNQIVSTDGDLNSRLLKKIDVLADALAQAFEEEGINLDANLVADDIRRDCGLMGDAISASELDVENNPFDAATKQMHDIGPIDTNIACQTLLNVPPHEFVSVFLNGLKSRRGLLPGGLGGRRAIPHRPEPRRIGEGKEKDYSYIDKLVKKYAREIREGRCGKIDEEVLTEKITDLKAYYRSSKNNPKFKEINMSERDFMALADIDPTHKEGTNGGGTYIEWLLRLITSGETTFREMRQAAHEYKDQLSQYDSLKTRKRIPENKRDIMQIKSLQDLMHIVATRGGEEVDTPHDNSNEIEGEKSAEEKQEISMSDFKQDLKDFPALCQRLTWPDKVEGTYEDHMELVGENSKWEVWKVKSPLGAFIFDQWGNGAKWCVGGFGYKGAEGKRSAEQYYPNYLHNGAGVYVCFQQKSINAPRPNNKALITFNDATRYSVSQFNNSNNSAYYSNSYGANTASEFARFLAEENLLSVLKGTEFGNCESIKDVETAERLKNGEPYIYNGEQIKSQFKESIKKVVFDDNYSTTVKMTKDGGVENLIGIPNMAFSGCVNLEEIELPVDIACVGFSAFSGCDKVKIKVPRYPNRRFVVFPSDIDFVSEHLVYI